MRFSATLWVGVLGLVSATGAIADQKDFAFRRHQAAQQAKTLRSNPLTFDQKINHADPADTRTFKQRYYLETSPTQSSNAPVFLVICGESTCEPWAMEGWVLQLARQFGAHIVAVEHRYYGKSQPFARLTPANLKHLTTANALEDLAALQGHLIRTQGLTGRWIAFGGSYAGSLAAYYRLRHPELVAGALSSSGPVRARENFEEYDHHVGAVAGPECKAVIQKATAQVEADLGNPTRLTEYKKMFDAEVMVEADDFLYLIADTAAFAIQYGLKDAFCEKLIQAAEPVRAFGDFAKFIFANYGMNALSGSAQGALSENPNDYLSTFGMRQWLYQSCTEYGYWQNAYRDPSLSTRSPRINAAYHRGICRRLFKIDAPVPEAATLRTFYEPLLDPARASAIYYTNGSTDPWSRLGITRAEGNDTNPETESAVIEGAAHCDDLGSGGAQDSDSMRRTRERFVELLKSWLR